MPVTVRMKLIWYKVLIAGCSVVLFFLYKSRAIVTRLINWCDSHQED